MRLTIGESYTQVRQGVEIQIQVALQGFRDIPVNEQLAKVLKVGRPFEKQIVLDQLIGILHLQHATIYEGAVYYQRRYRWGL